MDLRPKLFRSRCPFEFHLYNMGGFFRQPDRYWSESDKQRIRKCKHILVLLEELEVQLSPKEYRDQVTTFVGHLLNLMNDITFPIRLFTWMQPPKQATSCHSPIMNRTTDHPCDDLLKNLFHPGKRTFPARVHLLDNTDITLPLLNEGSSSKALVNVALRTYVVAGQQVAQWLVSPELLMGSTGTDLLSQTLNWSRTLGGADHDETAFRTTLCFERSHVSSLICFVNLIY